MAYHCIINGGLTSIYHEKKRDEGSFGLFPTQSPALSSIQVNGDVLFPAYII